MVNQFRTLNDIGETDLCFDTMEIMLKISFIICNIVIYNKKYIFGFCPFSGTELLKPLKST